MSVPQAAGPPSGKHSLLELVGALLAKTAYGHWVGRALALSLALEQAQDRFAVAALAPTLWARELLMAEVLFRVPQDRKVVIVSRIMAQLGVDPNLIERTCAQIKEVTALRNVIAHSSLSESMLSADGGLIFEAYRKGKAQRHEKSPQRIDEIIDGGTEALAVITQLQESIARGIE